MSIKSYKIGVILRGDSYWTWDSARIKTRPEAEQYAERLFHGRLEVLSVRVEPCGDPPTLIALPVRPSPFIER